MNNEQFRRLLLDHHQPNKTHQQSNSTIQHGARDKDAQNITPSTPSSSSSSSASASTNLLGSRMRSSIPMTPRHVRGTTTNNNTNNRNEFARQLAEQKQTQHQPPAKRFKASAAPKGTKYSGEYQDRTALRRQQTQTQTQTQDEDGTGASVIGNESGGNQRQQNVEQRLQALEEMVKLGQIDQSTFDRLRKEIGVGGDLKSTHLVKGLDWDLLKKAKAGEDLSLVKEQQQGQEKGEEDVDDELDRVLDETERKDFVPVPKEAKVKKGNLATTSARPYSSLSSSSSGKLSRDEILKQLKASRATTTLQSIAAAPPAESTLGAKFKKIDKSDKKRWIETDPATGRRKEILVITDTEGNSKRKTRWLDKEPAQSMMKTTTTTNPKVNKHGLLLPGQNSQPLGMEVPAVIAARIAAEKAAEAEAEDDDIFAGVGTDYNPLGDLEDDDDDDDDDDEEEKEERTGDKSHLPRVNVTEDKTVDGAVTNEQSAIQQQRSQRDYFQTGTKKDDEQETSSRTNILANDPIILAALKRAAALRQKSATRGHDDEEDHDVVLEEEESLSADIDDPERLARRKKFLEEARRRDALDALDLDYGFGSSRIEDEEDEEGPTFGDGDGPQRGSNKRKRGPKKRKGDKDSATDVLRVMEGRKKS